MTRGQIRSPDFARQLRSYVHLRWGSITPTDIDGFVEFNDRLFVFVETKYGAAPLSRGQRLALERLGDALTMPPRTGLILIAEHQVPVGQEIPMDAVLVREYRWQGRWLRPLRPTTVVEAIEIVREMCRAAL